MHATWHSRINSGGVVYRGVGFRGLIESLWLAGLVGIDLIGIFDTFSGREMGNLIDDGEGRPIIT
jgi:hypothetical protein